MNLSNTSNYCIVLHYSEIGLKGGNRRLFEEKLMRNVRTVLKDIVKARVERAYGRFLVYLPTDFDWEAIRTRLKKVVGLANFSLAELVEQSLEKIIEVACAQMKNTTFNTFRVTTRRAQKEFPLKSEEISAKVGAAIQAQSNAKVDLNYPEAVCYIEIFDKRAIVYNGKIAGVRGLPVGSSERAVSLLSSGIDSPVASYQIIRRGVKLIFVHFHSVPFTSEASINNTRRLVERLTEYQLSSTLYLVPFLEIQQAIMTSANPDYRVVLYRRAMLRIAEKIARRKRANALVTGESIGQVASQTLSNMRIINEGCSLPVLRPLSGSEKEEIIAIARQIDTYSTSIEPYEDCCSLFVPKHPVTRAKPEIVYEAENKLDLESLQIQAIREAERVRFTFPQEEKIVGF